MVKRFAMTAAAAVFALLILAPTAAQADPPGWWLEYSNKSSGKCMDVKDSSTGNGAMIQEYTCKNPGTSGAANQEFQVQASGAGVQFVNLHSFKCMEIVGWSVLDGGTADQSTCSGAANQQWTLILVSTDRHGTENYLFKNVYSGKCLHRANSGTPLYQITCASTDLSQVWRDDLSETGCTTCRSLPAIRKN